MGDAIRQVLQKGVVWFSRLGSDFGATAINSLLFRNLQAYLQHVNDNSVSDSVKLACVQLMHTLLLYVL